MYKLTLWWCKDAESNYIHKPARPGQIMFSIMYVETHTKIIHGFSCEQANGYYIVN